VVTLSKIISVVCKSYRVTEGKLLSHDRGIARVSEARQVVAYLERKHTDLSLNEIAIHLGGRDHSTVAHAVRAVERKMAEVDGFAARMGEIQMGMMDVSDGTEGCNA
jgi:chromosomal replication initiator protein